VSISQQVLEASPSLELFTSKEVEKILRTSRQKINRMRRSGELEWIQCGANILFEKTMIANYVASRRRRTTNDFRSRPAKRTNKAA
jgi:hypothetical protein